MVGCWCEWLVGKRHCCHVAESCTKQALVGRLQVLCGDDYNEQHPFITSMGKLIFLKRRRIDDREHEI